MADLSVLPHGLDDEALTVRAIIETPAGHRSKFDYHRESGLFALHDVLPAGMAFPMAFGFIPNTLGEDGDPLDIVCSRTRSFPSAASRTSNYSA